MTLEVENPSGFYTKEIELDPLIIVDSEIGTSTIAKIQIDENYNNAQSFSLVESTSWDCDFDTNPYHMHVSWKQCRCRQSQLKS